MRSMTTLRPNRCMAIHTALPFDDAGELVIELNAFRKTLLHEYPIKLRAILPPELPL